MDRQSAFEPQKLTCSTLDAITESRGRACALPTSRGAVNRQTFGEAQNTVKTGPK